MYVVTFIDILFNLHLLTACSLWTSLHLWGFWNSSNTQVHFFQQGLSVANPMSLSFQLCRGIDVTGWKVKHPQVVVSYVSVNYMKSHPFSSQYHHYYHIIVISVLTFWAADNDYFFIHFDKLLLIILFYLADYSFGYFTNI